MRTLAYLALLQNFVRIQALKMALIGATIIMLTEGSSMAATITVHARHETHRYDGRRPMIKLVVTTLFAAIIVVLLALSARAQPMHRDKPILPPLEYDHPYTGKIKVRVVQTIEEIKELCDLPFARALACMYRSFNTCVIVILPDETLYGKGWDPWHVMRHEIGHCNGWSGKHEGERVPTPEADRRWKRLLDEYLAAKRVPPSKTPTDDAVVRTLP